MEKRDAGEVGCPPALGCGGRTHGLLALLLCALVLGHTDASGMPKASQIEAVTAPF